MQNVPIELIERVDKVLMAPEAAYLEIDMPAIVQGSSLARDDEEYPDLPVSSLALGGLRAALDQFTAIRTLWVNQRAVHPAPFETMLRTALIGASAAYWLLGPSSRGLRTLRGLKLAADDLSDAGGTAREIVNSEVYPGGSPLRDLVDEDLEKRIRSSDAAKAKLEAMGELSRGYQQVSTTQMIRESLQEAFPADASIVLGGMLLWRRGSGQAHARLWPVLASHSRVVQQSESNRVGVRPSLSVEQFFTLAAPPSALALKAVQLLGVRGKP